MSPFPAPHTAGYGQFVFWVPLSLDPKQTGHSSSFCRDLINLLVLLFQLWSASLTCNPLPLWYFEITLFRRSLLKPWWAGAGIASESALPMLSAGRLGWQGGQAFSEGNSSHPLQSMLWKAL